MEEMNYKTKMLGLVTLYNPKLPNAVDNIMQYLPHLDLLIIWDNSPLEANLKQKILEALPEGIDNIMWHGDGNNYCIAPAINYTWHYAQENGFDLILLMDQDSQWENFPLYRKRIDELMAENKLYVYKPYIFGEDTFSFTQPVVFRRRFINSGTVIPVGILDSIGGADEIFALDALDTDMSLRILKEGYQIACLTDCHLTHIIGKPKRLRFLRLYTNDYGRFRTYTMTKSHIICYRKNKNLMTFEEKKKLFKEIIMWKFIRIILAEEDKAGRMRMFLKGIKDGITYKINS